MAYISEFVTQYAQVGYYLPDPKEIPKTPKYWIANVCATVLQDIFVNWVKEKVEERNASLVTKKGLAIEMDAELLAAF